MAAPEFVGLTEEAERKLKEAMPDAEVKLVPPDCPATCDMRSDAVQQLGVSTASERKPWSLEELVGLTAEEAERQIKVHMPNLQVKVVRPGCCVTFDYRLDRIRLHIDSSGRVIRPPQRG